MTMRRVLITITIVTAMFVPSGAAASAAQPASPRASCVAVITSFEASQLAPGAVGTEVSGLATATPGFLGALVNRLAKEHGGSIGRCLQAEG